MLVSTDDLRPGDHARSVGRQNPATVTIVDVDVPPVRPLPAEKYRFFRLVNHNHDDTDIVHYSMVRGQTWEVQRLT